MAYHLKGFRFAAFIAVLISATGLTLYPIVFKPIANVDEYKKLRKLHSWEEHKKRN